MHLIHFRRLNASVVADKLWAEGSRVSEISCEIPEILSDLGLGPVCNDNCTVCLTAYMLRCGVCVHVRTHVRVVCPCVSCACADKMCVGCVCPHVLCEKTPQEGTLPSVLCTKEGGWSAGIWVHRSDSGWPLGRRPPQRPARWP